MFDETVHDSLLYCDLCPPSQANRHDYIPGLHNHTTSQNRTPFAGQASQQSHVTSPLYTVFSILFCHFADVWPAAYSEICRVKCSRFYVGTSICDNQSSGPWILSANMPPNPPTVLSWIALGLKPFLADDNDVSASNALHTPPSITASSNCASTSPTRSSSSSSTTTCLCLSKRSTSARVLTGPLWTSVWICKLALSLWRRWLQVQLSVAATQGMRNNRHALQRSMWCSVCREETQFSVEDVIWPQFVVSDCGSDSTVHLHLRMMSNHGMCGTLWWSMF